MLKVGSAARVHQQKRQGSPRSPGRHCTQPKQPSATFHAAQQLCTAQGVPCGAALGSAPLRNGRERPAAMASMDRPMPAKLRLISCLRCKHCEGNTGAVGAVSKPAENRFDHSQQLLLQSRSSTAGCGAAATRPKRGSTQDNDKLPNKSHSPLTCAQPCPSAQPPPRCPTRWLLPPLRWPAHRTECQPSQTLQTQGGAKAVARPEGAGRFIDREAALSMLPALTCKLGGPAPPARAAGTSQQRPMQRAHTPERARLAQRKLTHPCSPDEEK